MNIPSIPQVRLDVSSSILWMIFCLALIVFSIMSLVYIYHWRNYGTGNRTITRVEVIYSLVGIVLLGISALFISLH